MVSLSHSDYIELLESECSVVYDIAEQARGQGRDPRNFVEIPRASDLADRTQKLLDFLEPRTTASQIRLLTEHHDGNREKVALDISKIVSAETYLYGKRADCQECEGEGTVKVGNRTHDCTDCDGKGITFTYSDKVNTNTWEETLEALENETIKTSDKVLLSTSIYHGVCAGLAVLTEGILVAPLDGVVSAHILDNADGSQCLGINYAGPIRSAGGTGQALSVLIGDLLRRQFGLAPAMVTHEETERYKEEVSKYARGLQYRPSNPQLEVIAGNCPVYVTGEGVGAEVTGMRDLPRVPTNKVREGMLLVMCEGLVLKAPKILKYVEALNLDGWDWLYDFVKTKSGSTDITPSFKFISDVLAGRPIFCGPMEVGGFRLRYGRSRLAGLATTACHPATMAALAGFTIVGTQLKYERPGKGTVTTPCDTIDGPYIQFTDGSARRIDDWESLPGESLLPNEHGYPIAHIWDLGELLVPVGEFLENNHPLAPSPYVEEWHEQVLKNIDLSYPRTFTEAREASISEKIPMCPDYVPAGLGDITGDELCTLYKGINGKDNEVDKDVVKLAYRLNIDIKTEDEKLYISGDSAAVVLDGLDADWKSINGATTALTLLNSILPYEVRAPTTIRIGARMGKPEGSKHRELKPAIHCLYPTGRGAGTKRLLKDAVRNNDTVQVGYEPDASNDFRRVKMTEPDYIELPNVGEWKWARDLCGLTTEALVKGDTYLGGGEKYPESMAKGILRFQNETSVFRDGTVRFDMVDITMTHFRPREIGMTVEQANALGYVCTDIEDILELKPQDIVAPMNCSQALLNVANFTDDLLEKFYGLEPYYNCENIYDLIGHLVMGLAPHTSGAVLARVIGFAQIKGHYGHPFYHAAKRRNCDGDIDSIMLLMDGLLNFSRAFLPRHRGGRMDAPLTLTTKILPAEVDKEALNVDIGESYPIDFYELTQQTPPPSPKEALKAGVTIVESVLGTPQELGPFGFTHDTESCDAGPKNNPYNSLGTMRQKTLAQFALGTVLEGVDNTDQAGRLINRHLIRDMRGNLRAFGQQKVRCTTCGASYRRAPLGGKCRTELETKKNPFTGEWEVIMCPSNVILTVPYGAVKKYDGLMEDIIRMYGCDPYIAGLYEQVSKWVKETFEDPTSKTQSRLL